MMQVYAKIHRATGDVLKLKRMDPRVRMLNKPDVWLPVERPAAPAFDPETHKLIADIRQPDLSDLAIDVPESAVRIEGQKKKASTPAEKAARKLDKIAALDGTMARVTEDLAVAMITGAAVPQEAKNRINARRALRGQDSV